MNGWKQSAMPSSMNRRPQVSNDKARQPETELSDWPVWEPLTDVGPEFIRAEEGERLQAELDRLREGIEELIPKYHRYGMIGLFVRADLRVLLDGEGNNDE